MIRRYKNEKDFAQTMQKIKITSFQSNDVLSEGKIQCKTGHDIKEESNIAKEDSFEQIFPAVDVAASNGPACDTNNGSSIKGKIVNRTCNDGSGKTANVHAQEPVQSTKTAIMSPKEEHCEDIKTLFIAGRCFAEIENSRKVFVINVPARSNFSNYSAHELNACETCMRSDNISSKGSQLLALTLDDFTFCQKFVKCKHTGTMTCNEAKEESLTCRICHSTATVHEPLVSPCLCTGSVKYVHESCLIHWLKNSVKTNCELCLHKLRVKKSLKPLNEWHLPDEKPVAVVWFLTFIIALTLNIASFMKDATRGCTATLCIVFYALCPTVAIFGVIFLRYWAIKNAAYLKKWLAFNQVWLLEEKYFNAGNILYETTV